MGLSNLGLFVPTHKLNYADSYRDIKPFAVTGPISRLIGSQVKNKAQQYNFLCDAKFICINNQGLGADKYSAALSTTSEGIFINR